MNLLAMSYFLSKKKQLSNLSKIQMNATTNIHDRMPMYLNSRRNQPMPKCRFVLTRIGCNRKNCVYDHSGVFSKGKHTAEIICTHHLMGKCRHVGHCWFRHIEDPQEKAQWMRFFKSILCQYGDRCQRRDVCPYDHEERP